MANPITLKTRLLNKYNSSVELMKGEINFIPATMKDGATDLVIMQVGAGDGIVKEFAAKASDVHDWAKASSKPNYVASDFPWLADFISGKIQDTNTTYTFELNKDGELVVKSKEVDSETFTTVATIDFVTPAELTTILNGYVTTSALNSKLEQYVTTSDHSADLVVLNSNIADAKKAGTDAAAALNTYKTANDAALAAVKKTAEDATTVSEVDAQIDAKIATLKGENLWDAKGDAAKAEAAAKSYADGLAKNYDAAGAAATAEQNAKDYADGLAGNYDAAGAAASAQAAAIAAAAADAAEKANTAEQNAKDYADDIKADLLGDDLENTFNTLKAVQDWVDEHGEAAADLTEGLAEETRLRTEADNALSARIKAYEDAKNTYATTSDLDEVSKVANAAQTATQVSNAINAKIEELNLDTRFDNNYDAKGAAEAAQSAAASDATTKANKALADAKAYTDTKDAEILAAAKAYADANDSDTTYSAGKESGIKLDGTVFSLDTTLTFILDGNA